ncbi:MAG: signal peptide peptidase SppA [Calditrichaeota bacterium]|nr:signal peptide peptidase SppA [Calditrichota bacterium]MCB9391102.1 signal peptide peptidase SppA [Calditrichota bacterium]
MSSNKACCWILGILVGGFVLSVLMVAWGVSRVMSGAVSSGFSSGVKLEEKTWLMIEPQGVASDYHAEPDIAFWAEDRGASLNEMLRALDRAAEDDKIIGVILRPQGTGGFATLHELREAILRFKKESDKPIYAHLDIASDRDYYLASIADSILMMPGRMGGINFGGIAYSSTYLRRTFEKLGIRFHVLHAGQYKGALEEFSRDSMSAEVRLNLETIFSDVFEQYVREAAESRTHLTLEALQKELLEGDQLIVSGESCLERGYVDGLEDWPVMRRRLQGDAKEFPEIGPHAYLRATRIEDISAKEKEVAVVYAEGEIGFGGGDGFNSEGITAAKLTKELDQLAEDEDVKAVVLRVNSPGGSALASKQILESVKRVKSKKPVVVSMGRIAASGGYYISAAADKILAEPSTLTGSIGVVTAFPTAEELYEKIGAREETISYGRWANFFRLDKTLTSEQERVIRDIMDSAYLEFRTDVMEGRGVTSAALDTIAEGRIWTGRQALARQLVDSLGGVEDAIGVAASLAELSSDDYDVAYYPKQKDFFEALLKKLAMEIQVLTGFGKSLAYPQDPRVIVEYVQSYLNRMEFVQTYCDVEHTP